MQALELEATKDTPFVRFDPTTGICQIGSEGCEAKPEDAPKFWQPILNWVADYIHSGNSLHLTVWLRYYNTSSSKQLLSLFDILETQYQHKAAVGLGQFITVVWLVLTTPADAEYDLDEASEWLDQGYSFPFTIEPKFSAEVQL